MKLSRIGSQGKARRVIGLASVAALTVSGSVFASSIGTNFVVDGTLTAGGNMTVPAAYSLDVATAGTLNVGTTTATLVQIGNASSNTSILGNLLIPAAYSIDVAAAGALNIGTTTANAITIGKSGVNTNVAGRLGVASTTPYVALGVTGTTTSSAGIVVGALGSPINQIVFGTCTPSFGAVNASSTAVATCTATGVTNTSGNAIVTPASGLPNFVVMQSASTTGANTIQIEILNTGINGVAATVNSAVFNWMSIR